MYIGKVINYLNNVDRGSLKLLNSLAKNPEEYSQTAGTYALYVQNENKLHNLKQLAAIARNAFEARNRVDTII